MSQASIKATVKPGDVFDVTNHYITREDHPCFGTNRRKVVRTSAANVTLEAPWNHAGSDSVPWKRVAQRDDGSIEVYGVPTTADLFLTMRPVAAERVV